MNEIKLAFADEDEKLSSNEISEIFKSIDKLREQSKIFDSEI